MGYSLTAKIFHARIGALLGRAVHFWVTQKGANASCARFFLGMLAWRFLLSGRRNRQPSVELMTPEGGDMRGNRKEIP